MKPKYARLMATLTMALFPFIVAWTLVLFTATHITPTDVFSSHVFWTLSVFYWVFYLIYECISVQISARQRDNQFKSERAQQAFEKFINDLKQSAAKAERTQSD